MENRITRVHNFCKLILNLDHLGVVESSRFPVLLFDVGSILQQRREHEVVPPVAHQAMQQPQQQQPPISGPRSKCDAVVYEAIAKACEIVVRGRCDVPSSNAGGGGPTSSSNANSSHQNSMLGASGAVIVGSDRPVHGIYSPQRGFHRQAGAGGGGVGGSSGSSRFNLEVEEVATVRCVRVSFASNCNLI